MTHTEQKQYSGVEILWDHKMTPIEDLSHEDAIKALQFYVVNFREAQQANEQWAALKMPCIHGGRDFP